jgi:type IV pilus assembly protein PilM
LGEGKELSALPAIIKKLHREANISSKNVSLALPESQVFTRVIKFPMLTDQETALAVRWEAEQYIPIPVQDAIVQHQIIERQENTSPPSVIVLLIAVPKVLVEKYIKVVQLSGLSCIAVESELISLVRALAPEQGVTMIIDFGSRSTDIAIARNGSLVFTRSITTAGEVLTRAVAKSLGVEVQQAEQYKRTYGLTENQLEGKVGASLMPVFNMVADEVKKAIHFYQTEQGWDAPKSIILTGGTSGLPGSIPMLTKAIGMEVVLGNPFSKVQVDPSVSKDLAGYAPSYSVAVGLALRGA